MALHDSTPLSSVLAAQRAAFNATPTTSFAARKANLQKLGAVISKHEQAFKDAISDDFGNRSQVETTIAEIMTVSMSIKHQIKHLKSWMRVRKAPTAMSYKPGRNRIIPQPLGVIGIISPWNYPLQLAILPLIGVLGAGNRAMIKPSEFTPRFSDLLKKVLSEAFSDDEVYVAVGGVDVAQEFSGLDYDHLVFTGSTKVGTIVAQAAAKNLVPCTLELGGKSPTIIDDSADMTLTTQRILNGKALNAGQTCVAPDYVLMPKSKIETFADNFIKCAEEFYPTFAGNPDYTSIVADSHYSRLQDLLEDAENKGARIRVAGTDDKQQLAKERRVPITVVTDTTPDMKIMQEEIFGPLLPIVASESLDESLDFIQNRDRPLALYWFGSDKAKRDKVLHQSISGGVTVNDCTWHVIQEDLPFGGVGPSGMGAYHGEFGFKSFSHFKGVFFQTKFSAAHKLYPPYTEKTTKLLNLIKKMS